MEALLEPGLQAFACGDEQAAAAGWSKCLGPRVCEGGRVYLLRDRAQVGTHSHPGRVLLRVRWQGLVFAVGAPPDRRTAPVRTANEAGTDLRPGQAPFAPGAGAPTGSRAAFGFGGAPPRCEPRSEAGTDQRLGQAPIRTRGGCSYGFGGRFGFVVGAPPRCEPRTRRARISVLGRPHSHPGRVLLQVRRNDLVFVVGAPP